MITYAAIADALGELSSFTEYLDRVEVCIEADEVTNTALSCLAIETGAEVSVLTNLGGELVVRVWKPGHGP